MFNIGPGELIAICMVALLVLGPERLPGAVRTVGRVVGELRRISGGFQNELRNAFEDSEIDELVRERRTGRSELPERPEKPHTATMKPAIETTDEADQADDAGATGATSTAPETPATRPEKAQEDGDAASDSTSERDSETVHDTPPPPVGGTPPTES